MLAFSVVHDSVLSLVDNNTHFVVSQDIQKKDSVGKNCHDIHNMFHFVGLVITYSNFSFLPFGKELFSPKLLQYTQIDKKTSYKPPNSLISFYSIPKIINI